MYFYNTLQYGNRVNSSLSKHDVEYKLQFLIFPTLEHAVKVSFSMWYNI